MKYIVSIRDKEEKNELSFEFDEMYKTTDFITKVMLSSDYIIEIFNSKKEN